MSWEFGGRSFCQSQQQLHYMSLIYVSKIIGFKNVKRLNWVKSGVDITVLQGKY